jgi:hypothetical protein
MSISTSLVSYANDQGISIETGTYQVMIGLVEAPPQKRYEIASYDISGTYLKLSTRYDVSVQVPDIIKSEEELKYFVDYVKEYVQESVDIAQAV